MCSGHREDLGLAQYIHVNMFSGWWWKARLHFFSVLHCHEGLRVKPNRCSGNQTCQILAPMKSLEAMVKAWSRSAPTVKNSVQASRYNRAWSIFCACETNFLRRVTFLKVPVHSPSVGDKRSQLLKGHNVAIWGQKTLLSSVVKDAKPWWK